MARPASKQTKAPAAYAANYHRNREREVRIARNLQMAATEAGLARVAPIGPGFTANQDALGFFVPGSAIVVWASPIIDYLSPNAISNSLIRIRFAIRDYWELAPHEDVFMPRLVKALRGLTSCRLRPNSWRVVEPPLVEWLWDQEPCYELLFDQPREFEVGHWGSALAGTCQILEAMTQPVRVAQRFTLLDISPVCDLASPKCGPECMDGPSDNSDEGSDVYCHREPYLPPGSLNDINLLLGPKGSASRAFADVWMHYRDWRYPVVENF